MLAIVAAILFAIAFILNATGTATSAIFDVTSFWSSAWPAWPFIWPG